uniref:Uncharacterized protein n=1 Tax=Oryza nivara TaxID=4536 RepID=A0A0E0FR53_ORYNI
MSRESLDWGRVREQVAQIVRSLLHSTPELVGFVDLPGGMVKPHNVLPIGFGLRAGCKRSEHHQGYPLQSSSLVAAITQTMFSTITTDTENSGIASATKTGVPASTVLQTLIGTMISPGKKSGISSVTNAGTDMHSSQEDCHTENYCQGFTPRKHPREEVEPEEDISPKRQQTTVKFGEASVSLIGVAEAEGKARLVELSM